MSRETKKDRTRALRGRWRGVALGLGALCLIAAGGAVTPQLVTTLSSDQLVRNFDTIVFHNEFDKNVDSRLRKWVAPVRVYVDVRAGDPVLIANTVRDHIGHLAAISGHDIAMTDDPGAANTTVVFEQDSHLDMVKSDYFAPDFDIRTVMQTNLCIGQYRSNSDYEITSAVVVIPIDRVMSRGRLKACVIEELTQVLGLPNDSDDVYPSIFNDRSQDVELTAQDILFVKLLYDSRLTAGMSRGKVLDQVRAILKEQGIKELRFGATDG